MGDLWASLVGPLGVPWELLVTFGAAVGVLKRSVGLHWDLSGPLEDPWGSVGCDLGAVGESVGNPLGTWLDFG